MKGLLATKKRIFKQVLNKSYYDRSWDFAKFSRFYLKTNENIAEYLKEVDFEHAKNALTVLASGDQYLNLLYNGITSIDTFDTNYITFYYALGIKRAMIIKYNYHRYLEVLKTITKQETNLDEITSIIYELLPLMDKDTKQFWQKTADYNYKLQKNAKNPLNLFGMLSIDYYNLSENTLTAGNAFLHSEENYNKLKNIIEKANISFKLADGANLKQEFNEKYDIIMLSNIMDFFWFNCCWGQYFGYSKLEGYRNEILSMLNDNGIAFLNYIFSMQSDSLIRGSLLNESVLTEEEVVKFPDITGKIEAGMLLVRKGG